MDEQASRRDFVKTLALSSMALGMGCGSLLKKKPSNVVIVFLDDSGWADFRPFADQGYPTPNVKQLAREGCCFHQFYVPQAICSASRASLLTGCYPGRTGVFGAHAPRQRGLDPKFSTIGELFKKRGYKTAVFGKWHVGDQPQTRPPARGFDECCGLMYSNDMWKHHPTNPAFWGKHPLQYWENDEVTIEPVTAKEQTMLTTWYTEHAVDFINRHREEPFLLYVPHSMPHVPIFCSDTFRGKSGMGLYADVMMEIDWSVGEINKALKANGVEDNTIVIFSSDNGPWISYGNHAGRTPYREAKGTSFDGGTRSACIIKYPGNIKAGTVSERTFSTIDLLPTLCELADVPLPEDEIDGKNVWDLIRGKAGAVNPHDYYAFSTNRNLESVMSGDGRWKLHLPHSYRHLLRAGVDGAPGEYITKEIDLSLFDLHNDPYEETNVIDNYPEIAAKLQRYAQSHKERFYSESPPPPLQ
jgi:arylsulfatase A-like enzyme